MAVVDIKTAKIEAIVVMEQCWATRDNGQKMLLARNTAYKVGENGLTLDAARAVVASQKAAICTAEHANKYNAAKNKTQGGK